MTSDLMALAERVEALKLYEAPNDLILEILPYFGREGVRHSRGWRQRKFGETHWNAWLGIFRDLDDVKWLLGDLTPTMMHSDPKLAVAAALRALAAQSTRTPKDQ